MCVCMFWFFARLKWRLREARHNVRIRDDERDGRKDIKIRWESLRQNTHTHTHIYMHVRRMYEEFLEL